MTGQDRRIPFTKQDEDRIASASTWGTLVAIIFIVSTLISASLSGFFAARGGLVMMISAGLGNLISLALVVLLGILLMQASSAFRKVARTDVADKAYLLRGFAKLHKFFLVLGISLLVMIVSTIVFFVLRSALGLAV